MLLVKVEDEHGKLTGAFTAKECDFKTGSKGFKATAKIDYNGKRYQVQTNFVEIHSKPQGEGEAETETDDAAE